MTTPFRSEDQNDAAAWAKYHGEYREALKGWIARFTESRELQHEAWFEAIYDDSDLPAEEGLRAMDDFLAEAAYQPREIGHYLWATSFLIDHKWQPRRGFDLLRGSDKLMDQWHVRRPGMCLLPPGSRSVPKRRSGSRPSSSAISPRLGPALRRDTG